MGFQTFSKELSVELRNCFALGDSLSEAGLFYTGDTPMFATLWHSLIFQAQVSSFYKMQNDFIYLSKSYGTKSEIILFWMSSEFYFKAWTLYIETIKGTRNILWVPTSDINAASLRDENTYRKVVRFSERGQASRFQIYLNTTIPWGPSGAPMADKQKITFPPPCYGRQSLPEVATLPEASGWGLVSMFFTCRQFAKSDTRSIPRLSDGLINRHFKMFWFEPLFDDS